MVNTGAGIVDRVNLGWEGGEKIIVMLTLGDRGLGEETPPENIRV